jgi:hypothetical protein
MECPPKMRRKGHLSVGSNKSGSLHRRAARADKANPLEITPERPRASRLTFVEDFTLEHSLPGLQITSIAMAGSF